MKKSTIIPTLLIAILLSSGAAFAWSGGHGKKDCDNSCDRKGQGMNYEQHEDRMDNRLEKMAIILDLTEKQKEQLEDLHEKNWQDRQAMHAEMQASRENLREYKQGKKFNESEFRAIAQKHADLKTEMMVQRATAKQKLFAVLTPEQQQKAEQLKDMRGEGFHGKRGGDRDCEDRGTRCSKKSGQRCNK